jgi:hypothetical protein
LDDFLSHCLFGKHVTTLQLQYDLIITNGPCLPCRSHTSQYS